MRSRARACVCVGFGGEGTSAATRTSVTARSTPAAATPRATRPVPINSQYVHTIAMMPLRRFQIVMERLVFTLHSGFISNTMSALPESHFQMTGICPIYSS